MYIYKTNKTKQKKKLVTIQGFAAGFLAQLWLILSSWLKASLRIQENSFLAHKMKYIDFILFFLFFWQGLLVVVGVFSLQDYYYLTFLSTFWSQASKWQKAAVPSPLVFSGSAPKTVLHTTWYTWPFSVNKFLLTPSHHPLLFCLALREELLNDFRGDQRG